LQACDEHVGFDDFALQERPFDFTNVSIRCGQPGAFSNQVAFRALALWLVIFAKGFNEVGQLVKLRLAVDVIGCRVLKDFLERATVEASFIGEAVYGPIFGHTSDR
jgi:hypothetical protein